ncbi:TPA: O-antigen ligase family protein [Aeromonas veronii]
MTIEKITEYFFALTIFFAFGFLYASARGHSYLSILVVISIILGLINLIYHKKAVSLNSGCGFLLKITLIYGVVMVFNRLLHGEDSALVRITLFFTAFVFFVPKTELIKKYAIYGAITGGWIVGFLAIKEACEGISRVGGYTNAILFAQGALVLLIINIYVLFHESQVIIEKLITIIGVGLSLVAIYLSQTRGVWLSLIVVMVVYFTVNRHILINNLRLIIPGLIIMFAAFSYNSNIFIQRMDDVKHNFIQMDKGNYKTSIGLRFVAWKSAWLGFLEYPLIGVGRDGFYELKKQQVSEHKVNPILLQGDRGFGLLHAHNQYLNQLVIRGIVGFIPMMILLGAPIFIRDKFGLLGVYLATVYLVAGLTDVPLEQKETLYIFFFAIFFATLIKDLEAKRCIGQLNPDT